MKILPKHSIKRSVALSAAIVLSLATTVLQASRTSGSTQSKLPTFTQKMVSRILRWVPASTPENACHGHFKVATNILSHPHPKPLNQSLTTINSKGPTTLKQNGTSVLQDHVVITQPGRQSFSDRAIVKRSAAGKIQTIRLTSHVRLEEPRHLVVAQSGSLDYPHNILRFSHVFYRVLHTIKHRTEFIWGKAQSYWRDKTGLTIMHHASYTTCNPQQPTWQLYASELHLIPQQHEGVAYNAVIKIYNVPVFYFPYFVFPIDNTRQSGWLMPILGTSHNNGFTYRQPYYWNMAPNYDSTITPSFYSRRGVALQTQFRYLTHHSRGQLDASFILHDKGFARFKQDTLDAGLNDKQPYLSALQKDSNRRGYFHFSDQTRINPRVQASLDVQYASDAYYLNDFPSSITELQPNQLLNQAQLNYTQPHWQASLKLQMFQTLHVINQAATSNQYQRLPQLDITGNQSHFLNSNTALTFNGQFVNFAYRSNFAPLTQDKSVGQRLHLRPRLMHRFSNHIGYLTPSVSLDNTDYISKIPTPTPHPFNAARTIPITSIDSGIYLQRTTHWSQHRYWQTLEPRLMYTFVPKVNQDHYPNFDTITLPFSYNQVFAYNQFTGFDRLQNTSQLALGLTSRLIKQANAATLLKADLGLITYFNNRQVCLTSACQVHTAPTSPLVSQLTYYPSPHWQTSASLAWDFSQDNLNNAELKASYNRNGSRVIDLGYDFVRATPSTPVDSFGLSNNTHLISLGIAWPLTSSMSSLDYFYYNLSKNRPQSYYFGLTYNTCCWQLQAVFSKQFSAIDPSSSRGHVINQYGHSFYLQFMLKGLGDIGSGSENGLIAQSLPGYQNPFLTQ